MFRFKQFTIYHDQCAMKVGTDGVLLGAWADCSGADSVLDIGTGSGLIALMLAQRSGAAIYALDTDESACLQATFNAAQSPFCNRVEVVHASYQQFVPRQLYDLIVSNPPYFSGSLRSPDAKRSDARHNDTLPFKLLAEKSAMFLSPGGKFSVILPYDSFSIFNGLVLKTGLKLTRKTVVRPTPVSDPKRILLEYAFGQQQIHEDELIIELSRHEYSPGYVALTRSFYLKM